jgi:hypothetical protein
MVTQLSSSNAMIPAQNVTNLSATSANEADSLAFSQAMSAAVTSLAAKTQPTPAAQANAVLLTDAQSSQNGRPNIKQFMDKTGASFEDASELIYGVIGSNTDKRNWHAIMSSNDPVSMARQATAALYNSGDSYADANNANHLTAESTIAKSGNFALEQVKDDKGKIVDRGLRLVDSQGLLLRSAGQSNEQIQRNAWLFGFDTAPLQQLVEPAKQFDPVLAQNIAAVSGSANATAPAVSVLPETTTTVMPTSTTNSGLLTGTTVSSVAPSTPVTDEAEVTEVNANAGSYVSTLDMLATRLALQNDPEVMKKLTDIMAKLS